MLRHHGVLARRRFLAGRRARQARRPARKRAPPRPPLGPPLPQKPPQPPRQAAFAGHLRRHHHRSRRRRRRRRRRPPLSPPPPPPPLPQQTNTVAVAASVVVIGRSRCRRRRRRRRRRLPMRGRRGAVGEAAKERPQKTPPVAAWPAWGRGRRPVFRRQALSATQRAGEPVLAATGRLDGRTNPLPQRRLTPPRLS